MTNLITDLAGVRVGSAHDAALASGVTAVIFDQPAVASIAVHGGAPASRDTELLAPHMTVERVDGFVLSGGSAFGLDAAGGAMAYLASIGRGYPVGAARVPILPAASLFDLLNGGDKAWGRAPPYWELGWRAAAAAAAGFDLGTGRRRLRRHHLRSQGRPSLGERRELDGFRVGALVAVNAVGRATRGASPYFWAAPYERGGEFGGLGAARTAPTASTDRSSPMPASRAAAAADPLALAEVQRAGQHHSRGRRHRRRADQGAGEAAGDRRAGRAGALAAAGPRPDRRRHRVRRGDRRGRPPDLRGLTEIGMLAAECVARAVARGVYQATPLAVEDAQPSWRSLYRR